MEKVIDNVRVQSLFSISNKLYHLGFVLKPVVFSIMMMVCVNTLWAHNVYDFASTNGSTELVEKPTSNETSSSSILNVDEQASWSIAIKATGSDSFDEAASFGGATGGTAGFNRGLDVPAAPFFGSAIATQVVFNKNYGEASPFGTRFSTDIRGLTELNLNRVVYEFSVQSTDVGNVDVELTLPDNFGFPVVFQKLGTTEVVNSWSSPNMKLSFVVAAGEDKTVNFRVTVGDAAAPTVTYPGDFFKANALIAKPESISLSFNVADDVGISDVTTVVTENKGTASQVIREFKAISVIDGKVSLSVPFTTAFTGFKNISVKTTVKDRMNKEAVYESAKILRMISRTQKAPVNIGWAIGGLPFGNIDQTKSEIFAAYAAQGFLAFDWTGKTYDVRDEVISGTGFFYGSFVVTEFEIVGDPQLTALTVPLLNGDYQLITNPFAFSIAKSQVTIRNGTATLTLQQAIDAQLISTAITSYNSSTQLNEQWNQTMAPFKGYWMQSKGANLSIVYSPFVPTTTTTKSKERIQPEPASIEFLARNSDGLASKVELFTKPNSGIELNAPPPPPHGFSLAIVGEHNGFGDRYMSKVMDGNTEQPLKLEISSQESSDITLSWDISALDANVELIINGVTHSLLDRNEITISSDDEVYVVPAKSGSLIDELPSTFNLSQNFPNPFNPSTSIEFAVPFESEVSLKIVNMLGQEVASLVNGKMTAGFHHITFDASKLSSGVYMYILEAEGFTKTMKMSLVK